MLLMTYHVYQRNVQEHSSSDWEYPFLGGVLSCGDRHAYIEADEGGEGREQVGK